MGMYFQIRRVLIMVYDMWCIYIFCVYYGRAVGAPATGHIRKQNVTIMV